MGGSRPSPARTRYYSGAEAEAVRDSATEAETAVTESSRGRRGSSFSASTRSSPAFIRLFTPNLVRLRTPTSPEPPRARRVEVDVVQVDVAESRGPREGEQDEAAAAAAGSDAPVSATEDDVGDVAGEEGEIAEGGGISGEVLGNNGRPADSLSRGFVVTEGVVAFDASREKQTLPMSPASLARNIPPALPPEGNVHGAWEGGGRRQMVSRSSSLSDSDSGSRSNSQTSSNGDSSSPVDSDSDSHFEGSEFGGGMTAVAAVLALRKRDKLGGRDGAGGGDNRDHTAMSAATSVATSPVTTKHASVRMSFGGCKGADVVNPKSSKTKPHPVEGSGTKGNVCGVDGGGIVGGTSSPLRSASMSKRLAGPASMIPVIGSHNDARNSDEEGNDSGLASTGRRTDGSVVSSTASLTSEVKGVASAEPGINLGTSPGPAPTSCPPASSGACQVDVTPSSGNTPNSVNLTPFRNSGTPGGSSGSAPKTPSLRTTPPIYRSLRTPGVGSMGTPSRRASSNGGSGSSRVGSLRRGGSSGMGSLFHRSSGGSSLSLSMTAKDSKGVIGAVRGVLDRALQLGSQVSIV